MSLKTGMRTWLAALAACTGLCTATATFGQAPIAPNDTCNNAIALTLNTPAYGTTVNATAIGDGPNAPCQGTSFFRGVWFTFTPSVSQRYQISACHSRFDSVLNVFQQVDCTTFLDSGFLLAPGGCNDDDCGGGPGPGATGSTLGSLISSMPLTAGQTYWIRLSGFSASGQYEVAVYDFVGYGACCSSAGVCSISLAQNCATSGTAQFLGAGSTCTVNPCTGACCNNTTFACTVTLPGTGAGGCLTGNTWQGFGSTCAVDPCPTGACCTTGAVCTTTTYGQCATGSSWASGVACGTSNAGCYPLGACCNTTTFACTLLSSGTACPAGTAFRGFGTTCAVDPCPTGACCASVTTSLACTLTLASACTGSSHWIQGGTCTVNPCSAACCNTTTFACTVTTGAVCPSGSTALGTGSTCSTGVCDSGACCTSTGSCTLTAGRLCASTNHFAGVGTVCTPNACTTACCDNTTGACSVVPFPAPSTCISQGIFSVCSPNPCASLGACCATTGACTYVLAGACTGTSTFSGAGTVCTPNPCGGACCSTSGTCTTTANAGTCTGTFQGLGTVCTPNPCGGACCDTAGVCTTAADAGACVGTFNGVGTVCTPNPCVGSCCNTATFACATSLASACTTPNIFGGNGTTCTTNPCPAPSNDLCAGAIALTPGTPFVTSNGSATSTNDGVASTCQTSVKNGLWFSLSTDPSGAGDWRFTNCIGAAHDTVITVFLAGVDCTGINTASNILVCNDDNGPACTGTQASLVTTLAASSTYLVRVQTWGSGTSGPFSILAEQLVATGVCCNNTSGACTVLFGGTCATGTTLGVGTTCDTSSCPASGICCNQSTGACVQIFGGTCASGSVAGTGTTCDTSSCPASATCCNDTNGACSLVYSGGTCPAGTTLTGTGTTCSPSPCPPSGACCNGTACTQVLSGSCTFTYAGDGSSCTPNVCFLADECQTTDLIAAIGTQTGSTVNSTTTFSIQPGTLCPGITTSSGGFNDVFWKFTAPATTNYTLDTCGAAGFDSVLSVHSGCPANSANTLACNDDSSTPTGNVACTESTLRSRIQTVALTAGQLYYVRVSAFGATTTGAYVLNINYVAPASIGSCCVTTTCTLSDSGNCSGTFTLAGVCTPNPCTPPGVCCRGSTCNTTITSLAACSASITGGTAGASFPTAAACNGAAVSNAPCCYGDYNKVGGITVTDIFNFLADWFAGSNFANVGGNGDPATLTVQNIFDFLSNWFAGCP